MKPIDWGGDDVHDRRFLMMVKNWIEADGELYIRVYHAKSGGFSEHWFIHSYSQFLYLVKSVRGDCGVEVYRHPVFPVRGIVSEGLISEAINKFDEGKERFLIALASENGDGRALGAYGDSSHQALEEELRSYEGRYVLIGPDIHFPVPPYDFPGEWIWGNLNNPPGSIS